MICIFIANEDPKLPIHNQRKFGTSSAVKISRAANTYSSGKTPHHITVEVVALGNTLSTTFLS
jgi:hypothetical protein